jgi:hypothetical protein
MQFIELCCFDNYIKAHIILNGLIDAGINCHLKDEYTVTIDPFLSPALGGIKIMVNNYQFGRAAALLKDMLEGNEPNDL